MMNDMPPTLDDPAIKVLVVDDDEDITSEIMESLSFERMNAVAAQDGPTALNCLHAAAPGSFTVMLTDVRMPGTDGLVLASDVRTRASEANAIEVVVMTGHGGHKLFQDATRIPAFECMAKPLSLSHLLHTIRRAHAATVTRRMNHRENISGLVRLLERAQALSERPLSSKPNSGGQHNGGQLPDRGPGWQSDPLGFVLAREFTPDQDGIVMTAEDARGHREYDEDILDRAGEQARVLLQTSKPLIELLLGRRPISSSTVRLRGVLDALSLRYPATLLLTTGPLHDATLNTDEHILSLVLDRVIEDMAGPGPNPLPIRIGTEWHEGSVVIRACCNGVESTAGHQSPPAACQSGSDWSPDQTGGLGLRIASAASRLLGARIERTSLGYGGSMTTLTILATAQSAASGCS